MKQTSLGTKILMLVVTAAVLLYFGVQALRYFNDPLSTTLAYTYLVEDGVELTGYVVREERLLSNSDSNLLRVQRAEGERVSTGGTVALAYADQASLERLKQIEDLTAQVEQLQYVQESALAGDASLKLDSEIMTELVAFRGAVAAERLDTAEELADDVKNLVLKREYTYSDTGDLEAEIAELQSQLQALQAQSAGSVKRITSPTTGLYSGVVDGYESVLTPDMLAAMTPSQLSGLQPDKSAGSNVGKLVLGDDWYYTAVMTTEAAEELQEDLAALAEQNRSTKLTLRFTQYVDRDLTVTLDSVGPDENGRCVVTFRGETYLAQLTLLRHQSAKIIYGSVEGIRVPKEAIRAQKVTVDEAGEWAVTEELGVYCIVGMEARFKPVKILYSGESFMLVIPVQEEATQESGKEKIRLRSGDEVIISARDLYDGKVVG